MLVPGRVFMPENSLPGSATSPYLRASYSIAPVEKFDEAMSRLADIIREEQEKVAAASQEQAGASSSGSSRSSMANP